MLLALYIGNGNLQAPPWWGDFISYYINSYQASSRGSQPIFHMSSPNSKFHPPYNNLANNKPCIQREQYTMQQCLDLDYMHTNLPYSCTQSGNSQDVGLIFIHLSSCTQFTRCWSNLRPPSASLCSVAAIYSLWSYIQCWLFLMSNSVAMIQTYKRPSLIQSFQ